MKKNIILIIAIFLISGCATVYNPATGRKEIVLFSTEREVELGKNFDKQVREEYKISNDEDSKERLNIIGQKVAAVCDRRELEYHFEVIEDDEVNAFAIPGGFIYVHSGLIKQANDDELACILAHEIGHISSRHPIKRVEAQFGYQIVALVLGRLNSDAARQIASISVNQIILGYSREDERLADKLAVKYAYNAGFNPNGMISFFYKLREIEKTKLRPPVFLSSHPSLDERIKNTELEIQLLENLTLEEPKENSANSSQNIEIKSQETPQNSFQEATSDRNGFCEYCNKLYSAKYTYCPYHGLKLR